MGRAGPRRPRRAGRRPGRARPALAAGRKGDPGAAAHLRRRRSPARACKTFDGDGRARRGRLDGDRPDHAHVRDRRTPPPPPPRAARASSSTRSTTTRSAPTRAASSRSRTPARRRRRSTGSRSCSSTAATARSTAARRSPAASRPERSSSSTSTPRTALPTGSRSSTRRRTRFSTHSATRARSRGHDRRRRSFDLVEGTMLPVDVADSNTVDGTLSRIPDGTDTDNAATDWSFTTTPTPGAANVEDVRRAACRGGATTSRGVSRDRASESRRRSSASPSAACSLGPPRLERLPLLAAPRTRPACRASARGARAPPGA